MITPRTSRLSFNALAWTSIVLLVLNVLAFALLPLHAATIYVRPDGGTATQCTGAANVAYDGAGSGEACALGTVEAGFTALAGGDTLVIADGSYGVAATLKVVPGGTQSNPTRVRGQRAGNCTAKPELWAATYLSRFVNVGANDWIELDCLELTDHNGCVYRHPDFPCSGAWALHGVYAKDASNLTLRDVNIHGLGNGFKGGSVDTSTWERVRIWANAEAGWHGATGCSGAACDSFTGTHRFTEVEIAWNGCGEAWPSLEIIGCHGDFDLDGNGTRDGYGDGFGTAETAGTWIFDRVYVHHNTSDGLDLRYTKLPDADVRVTRSWFFGNAGNPLKVWGKAHVENNVILANCGYFASRYGTGVDTGNGQVGIDPEPCRADGNALVIIPGSCAGPSCALVRHNTIGGESAALLQFASGGSTSGYVARVENNVVVGSPAFLTGSTPKLISNGAGITVEQYGNRVDGVSSPGCTTSTQCVVGDPLLRNRGMAAFDGRPASGSPLVGTARTSCGATPCAAPATDIRGKVRPTPATVGAFEP